MEAVFGPGVALTSNYPWGDSRRLQSLALSYPLTWMKFSFQIECHAADAQLRKQLWSIYVLPPPPPNKWLSCPLQCPLLTKLAVFRGRKSRPSTPMKWWRWLWWKLKYLRVNIFKAGTLEQRRLPPLFSAQCLLCDPWRISACRGCVGYGSTVLLGMYNNSVHLQGCIIIIFLPKGYSILYSVCHSAELQRVLGPCAFSFLCIQHTSVS